MIENIDPKNSIGKVEVLEAKDIPLHKHNFIQIIFVLEGEIDLFLCVKNYRLKKGDIFYIHHDDIHGIKELTRNKIVFISISSDFANSMFPNFIYETISTNISIASHQGQEAKNTLHTQIVSVTTSFFEGPTFFKKELSSLINLLHSEFRSVYVEEDYTFSHKTFRNNFHSEVISNVISEIYKSYNNKLSLGDLAESYCLSRDHLSHLFSQYTGLSFQDFVTMARIEKSIPILLNSADTIEKISMDSGFSHSRFYKKGFEKFCEIDAKSFREKYKHWVIGVATFSYRQLDYNEIISLIQALSLVENEVKSEPLLIDLNINDLNFGETVPPLSLSLYPFQVSSKEYISLMSDINANTVSLHCEKPLTLPIISFIENTTSNSSSTKTLSLENLISYISQTRNFALFDEVNHHGLFSKRGERTLLYYLFCWLMSFPNTRAILDVALVGKFRDEIYLMLSNLGVSEKIENINKIPENQYVIYHHTLTESAFEILKSADGTNISNFHINKSTEPTLQISTTPSKISELTVSLPPRSLNYIVLSKASST